MNNELSFYKGDDVYWQLTITDENDTIVDITGYIVNFTIKKYATDSDEDAILKKTITDHSDPTNGKTVIYLTKSDTDKIAVNTYIYDIQITDKNDKVTTVIKDTIEVLQDVT